LTTGVPVTVRLFAVVVVQVATQVMFPVPKAIVLAFELLDEKIAVVSWKPARSSVPEVKVYVPTLVLKFVPRVTVPLDWVMLKVLTVWVTFLNMTEPVATVMTVLDPGITCPFASKVPLLNVTALDVVRASTQNKVAPGQFITMGKLRVLLLHVRFCVPDVAPKVTDPVDAGKIIPVDKVKFP
jgi:hypothetical protein